MIDKNIMWIDVETTGLNPKEQDIWCLAAIYEKNEEVVRSITIEMQPYNYGTIQAKALEISHTSIAELRTFQSTSQGFNQFLAFLDQCVDCYNKQDKLMFAGHNTQFDMSFVKELFKKMGNKWFGSYFEYKPLDTFPLAFALDYALDLKVPNHKLETLARRFGIEIQAHDAMSDIKATRALFYEFIKMLTVKAHNVETQ